MIDVKKTLKDAEAKMQGAVSHLEETFAHIRAGRASVRLLDGIRVDYYGSQMELSQVANCSTPDAKSIVIAPWEKSMLKDIEKAIIDSSLGITPENNGEVIRLGIPPMTEDRRKALAKQSKGEAENAKVSIRNVRRDVNDQLKKAIKDGLSEDMEKDAEAELQKIHDRQIKAVDALYADKEKEIMMV